MTRHAEGIAIARQLAEAAGLPFSEARRVAADHLAEEWAERGIEGEGIGSSDVSIHLSAMALYNREELERRLAQAAAMNAMEGRIVTMAAELEITPAALRLQLAELLR